ncbi:MAG TPA: hypothetical protein VFE24_05850, partial [Pirellulales bacterium]|nr:hypothetical protein [Pirellulales bacterium]
MAAANAKAMTKAEKYSVTLSSVTLGLLILGSAGAALKFLAFDRALLEIEKSTKSNQDKVAAAEARRAETPILLTTLTP